MSEQQPASACCTQQHFRGVVRLVSFLAAGALTAISLGGFSTVNPSATTDLESTTEFSCMCFLGTLFGATLFFAEFFWEWFFFFFGFLRYRVGRSVLYTVSGVLATLMGLSRTRQGKQEFIILTIVGVCCIGTGILQLLAILVAGNVVAPPTKQNSSPRSWFPKRQPSMRASTIESVTTAQVPAPSTSSWWQRPFASKNSSNPATGATFSSAVQLEAAPIVSLNASTSQVPPAIPSDDVPQVVSASSKPRNPNVPSWMYEG